MRWKTHCVSIRNRRIGHTSRVSAWTSNGRGDTVGDFAYNAAGPFTVVAGAARSGKDDPVCEAGRRKGKHIGGDDIVSPFQQGVRACSV